MKEEKMRKRVQLKPTFDSGKLLKNAKAAVVDFSGEKKIREK